MPLAAIGAVLGAVGGAITTAAGTAGALAAIAAGVLGVGVLGQLAIEATVTAIAPSLLSLGALEIGATLTAPRIGRTAAGTQVDWQADPTAPVPYVIGRSAHSGLLQIEHGEPS